MIKMTYIFVDTQDNEDQHSKCSIEDGKGILKVLSIAFLVEVDGHQAKAPAQKK